MFIYASARSGEYETCTPTLTYARAKLNKDATGKCVHGNPHHCCHYCTSDQNAEHKQLLDVEELGQFTNQFNKLQLKQVRIQLWRVCKSCYNSIAVTQFFWLKFEEYFDAKESRRDLGAPPSDSFPYFSQKAQTFITVRLSDALD